MHEVDGKPLLGFCLADAIDPAQQAYLFRIYRPPFDALSIESITAPTLTLTLTLPLTLTLTLTLTRTLTLAPSPLLLALNPTPYPYPYP